MPIKLNPLFVFTVTPMEKVRKLVFIVCQTLFKAFIYMPYHISSSQQLEVLSPRIIGNQGSQSSVTKELHI